MLKNSNDNRKINANIQTKIAKHLTIQIYISILAKINGYKLKICTER